MERERGPLLIVRMRLGPRENRPRSDFARQPIEPRGADYENSLPETAMANRWFNRWPDNARDGDSRPRRPVCSRPTGAGDIDAEKGGRWRGRGPRGYIRKDIRIQEDVSDRLTDDPQLDASEIEVSVTRTEVLLQGFVESKWARRRAEDLADSVPGVTHVQNNLRIQVPGTSYARSVGGPDGADEA